MKKKIYSIETNGETIIRTYEDIADAISFALSSMTDVEFYNNREESEGWFKTSAYGYTIEITELKF